MEIRDPTRDLIQALMLEIRYNLVKERTLFVKLHDAIYPVSCEVLNQVFSSVCYLEDIETFDANAEFHSRILFPHRDAALEAFNRYNERYIYAGCCRMELFFDDRISSISHEIDTLIQEVSEYRDMIDELATVAQLEPEVAGRSTGSIAIETPTQVEDFKERESSTLQGISSRRFDDLEESSSETERLDSDLITTQARSDGFQSMDEPFVKISEIEEPPDQCKAEKLQNQLRIGNFGAGRRNTMREIDDSKGGHVGYSHESGDEISSMDKIGNHAHQLFDESSIKDMEEYQYRGSSHHPGSQELDRDILGKPPEESYFEFEDHRRSTQLFPVELNVASKVFDKMPSKETGSNSTPGKIHCANSIDKPHELGKWNTTVSISYPGMNRFSYLNFPIFECHVSRNWVKDCSAVSGIPKHQNFEGVVIDDEHGADVYLQRDLMQNMALVCGRFDAQQVFEKMPLRRFIGSDCYAIVSNVQLHMGNWVFDPGSATILNCKNYGYVDGVSPRTDVLRGFNFSAASLLQEQNWEGDQQLSFDPGILRLAECDIKNDISLRRMSKFRTSVNDSIGVVSATRKPVAVIDYVENRGVIFDPGDALGDGNIYIDSLFAIALFETHRNLICVYDPGGIDCSRGQFYCCLHQTLYGLFFAGSFTVALANEQASIMEAHSSKIHHCIQDILAVEPSFDEVLQGLTLGILVLHTKASALTEFGTWFSPPSCSDNWVIDFHRAFIPAIAFSIGWKANSLHLMRFILGENCSLLQLNFVLQRKLSLWSVEAHNMQSIEDQQCSVVLHVGISALGFYPEFFLLPVGVCDTLALKSFTDAWLVGSSMGMQRFDEVVSVACEAWIREIDEDTERLQLRGASVGVLAVKPDTGELSSLQEAARSAYRPSPTGVAGQAISAPSLPSSAAFTPIARGSADSSRPAVRIVRGNACHMVHAEFSAAALRTAFFIAIDMHEMGRSDMSLPVKGFRLARAFDEFVVYTHALFDVEESKWIHSSFVVYISFIQPDQIMLYRACMTCCKTVPASCIPLGVVVYQGKVILVFDPGIVDDWYSSSVCRRTLVVERVVGPLRTTFLDFRLEDKSILTGGVIDTLIIYNY